jgi:hypothetical protein
MSNTKTYFLFRLKPETVHESFLVLHLTNRLTTLSADTITPNFIKIRRISKTKHLGRWFPLCVHTVQYFNIPVLNRCMPEKEKQLGPFGFRYKQDFTIHRKNEVTDLVPKI